MSRSPCGCRWSSARSWAGSASWSRSTCWGCAACSSPFAPFGYSGAVESARAGSTVGLPAATADLMVLNLVIVVGLVSRKPALAKYLAPVALLLVVAVFSAAEFSSVLGLVVATVCVAARLRRLDLLKWSAVALPVAVVALWRPSSRASRTSRRCTACRPAGWCATTTCRPTSGRRSLTAATSCRRQAGGAGSCRGRVRLRLDRERLLWLLWGGGLPLLAAFCWFVWTGLKATGPAARLLATPASVAALAGYTGLVSCVVLDDLRSTHHLPRLG